MTVQINPENKKILESASRVLSQLGEWGVDVVPIGLKTAEKLKTSPVLAAQPVIVSGDKQEALQGVRDTIGDCKRCKLCEKRTHIVFGSGNPEAELMFVGEGPGADEDEQGLPFVGKAGQLLTKMIEAMGIKREDVYIANIVKCRPPGNRNPEPDEIVQCSPFLKQQIEIIKPKVIVCLGKFAAQTLLQTEIPITKLRGDFRDFMGIQFMPTYHPAFLLRNPDMKKFVWEDLKKVMILLGLKPSKCEA
ncbi:uracil-DNA glycosylase [bacterium]|nr:uracil-DNA glycosylase [bacterium]